MDIRLRTARSLWFLGLGLLGCWLGTKTCAAQDNQVITVAAKRCTCGRWTCPACQQQKMQSMCPPSESVLQYGPQSLPEVVPGTNGNVGSGDPQANNTQQNNAPAPQNDSESDFNASLRSTLSQSSNQRNLMAFNSGGMADPGLIGDYFGPGSGASTIVQQGYNSLPTSDSVIIPSTFSGQRMKLSENTSPIPQNRIFVNYSLFDNVPLTNNGITVNRLSPGFESLLFSPNTSFEMRTPMATTLDNNISLGGTTNTNSAQFGNMFFSLKHVLHVGNQSLISGGMSMTVPTAEDVRVFNSQNTELVRIQNQSVHLMPFVAGFYKPSQRTFMQSILQVDVDANGNTVYVNPNTSFNSLDRAGRLQDMTLLYLDFNVGYWAYRNQGRGLTGIAPILEAHYNRSLNHADCVVDSNTGSIIQTPIREYDNINIVSALIFEFNQRSRLGVGYGVPIGNGSDRAFDNEFRLTFNRFF